MFITFVGTLNYYNEKIKNEDKDSIFHYYKSLISLRHEIETIVYGYVELIYPENENIFAYRRNLKDQNIVIVLNFYENNVNFKIPEFLKERKLEVLLSNYNDKIIENNNIKLRPYEAIVYKVE